MWDLRCYQYHFFFLLYSAFWDIWSCSVTRRAASSLPRGGTSVFLLSFSLHLPSAIWSEEGFFCQFAAAPQIQWEILLSLHGRSELQNQAVDEPALCMSMYLFFSLILLCIDTIQKSILSIWEGRKVRTSSLGKIQFILIFTFNCSFCYMSSCFLGWMRNFYSIFAWFCIIFHVKIWDAEV